MIYLLLLFTGNNNENSHSQTQDYSPPDVPDDHEIMMPPNDQTADPQHYQNHALSGIGTFTQCRLCDIYVLIYQTISIIILHCNFFIFQVMLLQANLMMV